MLQKIINMQTRSRFGMVKTHLSYRKTFEPAYGEVSADTEQQLDRILNKIYRRFPNISDNNAEYHAAYCASIRRNIMDRLCIDTSEKLDKLTHMILDCIAEFSTSIHPLVYYIMWQIRSPNKFVHRIKRSTSLPTLFRLVDDQVSFLHLTLRIIQTFTLALTMFTRSDLRPKL